MYCNKIMSLILQLLCKINHLRDTKGGSVKLVTLYTFYLFKSSFLNKVHGFITVVGKSIPVLLAVARITSTVYVIFLLTGHLQFSNSCLFIFSNKWWPCGLVSFFGVGSISDIVTDCCPVLTVIFFQYLWPCTL